MGIPTFVLAAIASFALGALWYTVLFGRPWRRLMGVPEGAAKEGMAKTLAVGFLVELLRAYVMLKVVAAMGAYSFDTGVEAGFWVWLGFVATVGVSQVLYERRGWKLFAITYGYHLAALLLMGGILAAW